MEPGSNHIIHIRDISNYCVGSWCVVVLEVGEDDNICTIDLHQEELELKKFERTAV